METLGRDVLLRVLGHVACHDVLALACSCREMARTLRVRLRCPLPLSLGWTLLLSHPACRVARKQVSWPMCACSCGAFARLPTPCGPCAPPSPLLQDDEVWRELAEHKWGPAVRQLARVQPGQWAAWVKHRLSTSSSPPSPLDLVQVGRAEACGGGADCKEVHAGLREPGAWCRGHGGPFMDCSRIEHMDCPAHRRIYLLFAMF